MVKIPKSAQIRFYEMSGCSSDAPNNRFATTKIHGRLQRSQTIVTTESSTFN